MKDNLKTYVADNNSLEAVSKKYIEYFDKISKL